jgi:phosphoribosylformimino-5-aminoimidazole carboxamide ribonucleotide (ProFAR) isomerase
MPRSEPRSPRPIPGAPMLLPCLLISHGRIMVPGEGGPTVARDASKAPYDLFDVSDRLMAEYRRLYVVDLDGVDQDRPQLDYLQEIARAGEVWVDAGVRSADQAIDVLVGGAQRAVLSTAFLKSERELKRAWRLSSDVLFEIEVRDGKVPSPAPEWVGHSPAEVAGSVRALGPTDLVLSFRETPVDWTVVRSIAHDGPVWVDGTFERSQASNLAEAGCHGGIFHIDRYLSEFTSTKEPE